MQEDLDLPYDTPWRSEFEMRSSRRGTWRPSEPRGTVTWSRLPDSHWRLSLAVNRGNAAGALLLSVGEEVRLKPSAGTS